jgi:hypothetical protein
MNVIISERATKDVVVRYEVHLAGEGDAPPDDDYFDDAWQRAVAEGLVDGGRRDAYDFKLQKPQNLYESSV